MVNRLVVDEVSVKSSFVTDVETVVPEGAFIYSRTDLKGLITEANEAFCQLSGYTVDEMLGQPHNLVRHPDMPKEAFADLWRTVQEGRPWQGLVKNRRKDGGFYWVIANASPVRENGRIVGYQSLRYKPSRDLIRVVAPVYAKILAGNSGLYVEDGYAFPQRNALRMLLRQPEAQLTATLSLGLLVGLSGLIYTFAQANANLTSIVLGGLSILGILGAGWSLLSALPALRRHQYAIEKYMDHVLQTGDLTETALLQHEVQASRVVRKLLQMTNWMRTTVLCIQDAVQPVSTGTAMVQGAISEIERAARSQNDATNSVAAASTELDLTIREVAEHLQQTESAVSDSGEQAVQGALVSQKANDKIQSLAGAIRTASSGVEALGSSTAEVGAIAAVIKEIADQTNLLALNASIEAARAGEAGRGFAVVANEVRRLADRTMQATAKIDTLISNIASDSQNAITSMRASAAEMEESEVMVQQARDALQEINERMGEAVAKVSEIATASSQQTEAMREISTNITHVAAMSEQNVGVVLSTTEQINAMTPLVQRVVKAVTQYRV